MSRSFWLADEVDSAGPAGVSDAALMIDRSMRKAVDHWNETITSERAGIDGTFRHLAAWWKCDTEFQSSVTRIAMHPGYQRIIGMGRDVLPLILRDLEAAPAPWFWALRAITGIDPVPVQDRGYIDRMTRAWIRWGIQRNLV
jgi:hypothetical protein